MKSADRRDEIIKILKGSSKAVSGKELASQLNVSRQVIVQDIALLRANGEYILSTNLGYVLPGQETIKKASRVFKVCHTDSQARDELEIIVDYGGIVDDVFVYHKVYGVIKTKMEIRSHDDIDRYMAGLNSGTSTLLKNITSNYHYHTVLAANEKILDVIQEKLQEAGFLAQLLDYEPVNFWE